MEDYSLVKQIGRGSYGKVWLVKKNNSSKQYVLKQIDMQNATRQEQCSAYTEVKLLSTLKHPNIVTYYNSFQSSNGILNIIMGYCENGDLYTYIRSHKGGLFSEKQVVEWFIQICMALQFLHEKNILHRDLKTQNIFLTKTKIIKIGDLGIARVLNSTCDLATTLIGTPYYMSPELFANQPYNHKSDVWALGCCVYEMTTLRHAFNARDLNSLMYKVLLGKLPNMPKQYSQELVDLMCSMLCYDASSRPSVKFILQNGYVRRHIMDFLQESSNRCRKSADRHEKCYPSKQNFPIHRNSTVSNTKEHSELNKVNEDLEAQKNSENKNTEVINPSAFTTESASACEKFQELKSGNYPSKAALSNESINEHIEVPEDFSKNVNAKICNLPYGNEIIATETYINIESSASGRTDLSYHTKEVDSEKVNIPRRRHRKKWRKALSEGDTVSNHNESNINQENIHACSLPSASSQLAAHALSVDSAVCSEVPHVNIHRPDLQQNKCAPAAASSSDHIVYKNSEARRRRREKLQKQQLSSEQTYYLPTKTQGNSANQVAVDHHKCAESKVENVEEKMDAEIQEFIGMLHSTLRMNDNEKQSPISNKGCENKTSSTTDSASKNHECIIQRRDLLIRDCRMALGDGLLRKVLDAIDYAISDKDLQSRLLNMLGKELLDAYGGKLIQLKICEDAISAS